MIRWLRVKKIESRQTSCCGGQVLNNQSNRGGHQSYESPFKPMDRCYLQNILGRIFEYHVNKEGNGTKKHVRFVTSGQARIVTPQFT